jgi:hypothetical protein
MVLGVGCSNQKKVFDRNPKNSIGSVYSFYSTLLNEFFLKRHLKDGSL